ncbi:MULTISPECIES: hypothetical protein [Acetobacter]|uniref:hypothetical protein n=1 Tax=Acetobacter TaxID=434 RepID=UPI000B0619F2|nr:MULTISPECIES: hypothetical protein [Acetobacter]MCP1271431.1 hypothetical protein [Acetobacter cerevisiae]MCP1279385.1 hypothetical protein [Acetobacter cerevisiae]
MPHPYCSTSHGRPVCTAKHILPLFVLLGGMPAFAAAETASPDPKTTQPASTIPEPSPLLRDQTRAMTESCRAWLPTTLPAMREGEKGLPPSVQLSSETRHQRDLCAMAIEPDQVERSLLLLTMGAAWGLLLTLAVLGYVLYRANNWLTGIVKNKYAFLKEQISFYRNRNS